MLVLSNVRSCTAEGLGGTKPPMIPVCESGIVLWVASATSYRVECAKRMAQATSVFRERRRRTEDDPRSPFWARVWLIWPSHLHSVSHLHANRYCTDMPR